MPRALRYALYGLLGCLLAFSFWVANLVILPSEAATLRDSLLGEQASVAKLRVQLHLDWLTASIVRQAVCFAAPINAEQKEALGALRSAAVGVYKLDGKHMADVDIAALDARMARQGWKRFLLVDKPGGELVAGYTPASGKAGSVLPICIAVREHDNLVVVSARARVDNLIALAKAKCGQFGPGNGLAHLCAMR